tara:strand:- start:1292 stop:1882 length:591 start_codon:yes stop_codon:yes gene_type:complete
MKSVMEIFKLATRINIKPKDVIGVGGDIVKMGQSLFNTKVNPKLTEYINKTGKIPDNIMEQIKIHMRSMKNATDSQIELFKLNLKDIVNAKFPPKADVIKMPVSSDKALKMTDKRIDKEVTKMMDDDGPIGAMEKMVKGDTLMNSRKYLIDEINKYNKTIRTDNKTIDELKEILMRLDTEGIPFAAGGIANHFRNK